MTSLSTASRPRRRLIVAASSLVMALSLSACQVTSPITTDLSYEASDGVNVQAEGVSVDGVAIISQGEGAAGILTGAAVNETDTALTVTIAISTEAGPVDLEPAVELGPNELLRLDGLTDGEFNNPVTVDTVETIAGGLADVEFTTSTGAIASTQVPVLLPEGPYAIYAEMLDFTPEETESDEADE